MQRVFNSSTAALIQSHELLEAMDPDRHLKESPPAEDIPAATFADLSIGDNVKILVDTRVIVERCFDAGLSVENSEWRKKCAGCLGKVLDLDIFDRTVCVYIAGVGKLWFAPGAMEAPHKEHI